VVKNEEDLPDKTKSTHTDRLKVSVSVALSVSHCRRIEGAISFDYLLVISKVVPKICARTNSAIVKS